MDPSDPMSFMDRVEEYDYAAVEKNVGDCDCGIDHFEGRVTGWSKSENSGIVGALERSHDVTFELVSTDEL